MSSNARRVELEVGLALAALGYLLGGLGACVAVLARDLDEPASRLALLPSAFALGLLIIAFVGPILLRTGRITAVLRGGALVCALGAVLVALAPSFITAVSGGLLIGLGGALLVLLAPLLLSGPTAAARLTKVNAVGSATGILAPLAIGGLDSLGPTGRLAMLVAVPPFLVLIVIAAPARAGQSLDPTPAGEGSPWLSAFRGWSRVVLAVAVEFCFVVWSVARLVEAGLPIAIAALLGSAFPIGMAVGRSIGPIHFRGWAPLVPAGVLALSGSLLVSLFGSPAIVVTGLLLAGVGVAPLYPLTIAELVATPGIRPVRLAALGALASATAILAAPTILAALATVIDLSKAFLITIPVLLVLFLISRPLRPARPLTAVPAQAEIGSP